MDFFLFMFLNMPGRPLVGGTPFADECVLDSLAQDAGSSIPGS